MKRVHLIFCILLILATIAGVLHTSISYIVTRNNYDPIATSFPAEAVLFYVGIWYVIGIAAILFVWLIVWLIKKRGQKAARRSSNAIAQ